MNERAQGSKIVFKSLSLVALLAAAACNAPGGENVADEEAALGGTCDPSRANGAVSPFERALLDTLATTEGTYHSDAADGYDTTRRRRRL
jgi:hypothetical protein